MPDLGIETALLDAALAATGTILAEPEAVILVDRSPHVQAAFLFLGSTESGWHAIGAAPVSTVLPGRYEHFQTPWVSSSTVRPIRNSKAPNFESFFLAPVSPRPEIKSV